MSPSRRRYSSATMRSPLRSKRAMIAPVRPRAKASGLTRIRVRSTFSPRCRVHGAGPRAGGGSFSPRNVEGRGLPQLRLGLAAAAAAARGRLHRARDLVLAVRADRPVRVQRLAAADARVLELAQAVRAAQEVGLHVVVAVRAGGVLVRG